MKHVDATRAVLNGEAGVQDAVRHRNNTFQRNTLPYRPLTRLTNGHSRGANVVIIPRLHLELVEGEIDYALHEGQFISFHRLIGVAAQIVDANIVA
ncbi:MAG: hypothetical protein MAG451_00838 [Anaerolineales bacterium]|nr:hypothetical protein [Anaerolineales bacterium]